MKKIGLTGGIGSGKSTFAALLASKGAVIIDADEIARKVVEPGTPQLSRIIERFGAKVLGSDGHLDRQKVAEIVFSDPNALADLNAITHPAVYAEMAAQEERARADNPDAIIVFDIPLLSDRTKELMALDGVIVVDADHETAITRLVTKRKMNVLDARSRIASQMPRDNRLKLADIVVTNADGLNQLAEEADRVWFWIQNLVGRKH